MININEETQKQFIEKLENAEDKSAAIVEVINEIQEQNNNEIIEQLMKEQENAIADKEYEKKLGLRTLSKEEKDFYSQIKLGAKQSVTFDQNDAFPTSIIDRTIADLQTKSEIMKLIKFTPADVKKWITGSYTGSATWKGLSKELVGELEATIGSLNIELGELTAYLVIPKAITDLSLPFIDKFFRTVLQEAMIQGIEEGYLIGDGNEAPIGIYKQIDKSTDGVHTDKTVNTDVTNFSPKGLAKAKNYLSKDGKRVLTELVILCNPADEANFVDPALYDATGNNVSSFKNIRVVPSVKNPQGKAAIAIPNTYTMGFGGIKETKYDQTLALKDADLFVSKLYGNGRADDDNTAYVFDVTKLEEYVPTVKTIAVPQA